MEKILREQFLDRLQNSWQPYVTHFYRITPQERKAFLDKQGYATLSGLLAHIIAWWQDGAQEITKMQADSTLPLPDYEVDSFNARAVEKFGLLSETDAVQAFETQCWPTVVGAVMVDLVKSLPADQLAYANINTRLYYEIMHHWTEHELS